MAINKTIFFIIGVLLVILGAFMLIPYIVQMIYDENSHSFLSSAFITIFIGVLFILANLDQDYKLNLQQTFLFSSLAWISAALFGSIPFHLSVLDLSFSEAFFESMSGITTTGSTVINDLDYSPKSILIWRAIMQWLGGIGIIVMAITVLPLLKVGGMQLFKMEGSDSTEKILPRTVEVASIIILTYLLLTFLCAVLYWVFDMSIFDSIAHSMTTIATGGFSTHNTSIEYFKSSNIEIIATIFIILGSIPFISYLKFIKGNRKIFFNDVQIRGFVYLIFISILVMFFLFLMFVGGCAGSTTCGIKIFRFQLLYIFIGNQIKKLFYPNSISVIKYNNQKISNSFIHSIIIFIFSYLFLFLLLAILLSITGLDFLSAISGAATSISNVGPGLGEMIGPNGNFKEVSDISKWLLSFGMLLGRLELFAVLVLFFPSFWKD